MKFLVLPAAVLVVSALSCTALGAERERSAYEECIMRLVEAGPGDMTVDQLRRQCIPETAAAGEKGEGKDGRGEEGNPEPVGVVGERLDIDQSNTLKPFAIMAHRQNYILLGAYNSRGWDSGLHGDFVQNGDFDFDDVEVQFQISIKTPLAVDLFDGAVDIYTAYTARSFWQAYNTEISSPFRETDHEPEFWFQVRTGKSFGPFKNTVNVLGISHQSNGQSGELSRGWNRLYAGFGFEYENFALLIKPWVSVFNGTDSDNPDITDYLGHGELRMAYRYGKNTFSLMTRNNLESGFSRGALELGWSFPFPRFDYLKGYIQYFSGYGESLIDYNRYVNRIGVGLILTDLL